MPKNQPGLLGPELRKLQPKLRMIANGDTEVNTVRAEQCSAVKVASQEMIEDTPPLRGDDAAPMTRSALARAVKATTPDSLARVPNDIVANVFVETTDSAEQARDVPGETARRANLRTATVPLSQLKTITEDPRVTFVELGEPLAAPTPIVASGRVDAPSASLRRFGSPRLHGRGKGVLIGIIDVQGFDFAHRDFLDRQGKTRFVRIWDQGGDTRTPPNGFDYGAEIRKEHLDLAIAKAPEVGLPAQELERQSQMAEASHATHVASIAAGNRGVCPEAFLAGVLVDLPAADQDRRLSFYDSTRIAHAVDYLIGIAAELKVPVSINISLGTNGHAHDASAAVSRWLDTVLAIPGRSICVAAGNAGQEVSAFEGDTGYVLGRIHTSGRVPSRGLNTDIEWLVVGNGIADISENELEIWYSPRDRFSVSVRPPGGDWIGPIAPRQFIENRQLRDGSFVSIYNELYHPANGSNWISVYLSPLLSPNGVVGVRAGQWIVRLAGDEVRDGDYHGWIERDDPRRLGRIGMQETWSFPSFFSERSNVDNSSVSSLACGQRIISVANLDDAAERMNVSSSQGPTRDNRFKPDVAAPGTNIVAAKGFAERDDAWVSMTGTSMASPFVAGVAGLMLAVEPKLTAAQIGGILQRTARPLPGANFTWLNDAGFGRIDPEACLVEASRANTREDRTS